MTRNSLCRYPYTWLSMRPDNIGRIYMYAIIPLTRSQTLSRRTFGQPCLKAKMVLVCKKAWWSRRKISKNILQKCVLPLRKVSQFCEKQTFENTFLFLLPFLRPGSNLFIAFFSESGLTFEIVKVFWNFFFTFVHSIFILISPWQMCVILVFMFL